MPMASISVAVWDQTHIAIGLFYSGIQWSSHLGAARQGATEEKVLPKESPESPGTFRTDEYSVAPHSGHEDREEVPTKNQSFASGAVPIGPLVWWYHNFRRIHMSQCMKSIYMKDYKGGSPVKVPVWIKQAGIEWHNL